MSHLPAHLQKAAVHSMIGECKLHDINKHVKPTQYKEVQPTEEEEEGELERHRDRTNPRAKAKAKARYRWEKRTSRFGRRYTVKVGQND